ncbi:hypothetical protein IE077_004444 [Cardiosporidium cionae]|uniref:Uncharacterized protein n=1 Tax=Cardiosporidium cionae TaxID=476202 RepID=A0ABQ7J9L6_9APIC|nr:hypothetical protein IE077_004444 [Cardiosporidium cionae]|eukprot:KAF8820691.1 hypothetical protein IE077_004444 [Cardiosporidium cionae]
MEMLERLRFCNKQLCLMNCSASIRAAPALHQHFKFCPITLLSTYFSNYSQGKLFFPHESITNRNATPGFFNIKNDRVPILKAHNMAFYCPVHYCAEEPLLNDKSFNLFRSSSNIQRVESNLTPAIRRISSVTTCKNVGRYLPSHGSFILPPTFPCHFITLSPKSASSITFSSIDLQKRFKMTKVQAYKRSARASPSHQSVKAHIGVKRLSAEYVQRNQLLVKQRKNIAFNPAVTRLRHFKIYPGENVKVLKNTSLAATCDGRVKFSFNPFTKVKYVNILPEQREELLPEDLWRYRTEHTRSMEENRHLCFLRTKATPVFPKPLVNPPTKPPPRPRFLGRWDEWENPSLPDSHYFYK